MDENNRKLVILDLALALIVFALFGMSSLTFNSHHADPEIIQAASDAKSDNYVGTSTVSRNHKLVLHHVSMETTSGSTPLPEFVSEIPNNSGFGAISNP